MGVFWRRLNGRRRFTLIGSDIREVGGVAVRADFRQLPYAGASISVVAIDPPYTHCGHYLNNHRYGSALTDHMRHVDAAGFDHSSPPGGTLWVKCKDENDGKQNWTHCTLREVAVKLGLQPKDLFVLAPRPAPTRRWQRQKHARKTHSYLWIFRKTLNRTRGKQNAD
jgi:hypothetical protein